MLPIQQNDGQLRGGWKTFILRRAKRILPPFYPALLISFLVSLITGTISMHVAAYSFMANFFLIQNVLPQFPAINIAFWSVATEWHIYFLLPFVFLPLWSIKQYGKMLTLLAGFLIGSLCFLFNSYSISHACYWYAGLFTLGMLASDMAFGIIICNQTPKNFAKNLFIVAFISAICSIIVLSIDPGNALNNYLPHWRILNLGVALRDTLVGIMASCFILYLIGSIINSQSAKSKPVVVRFLELPILEKLGRFSYSLYLTHGIVLIVFNFISTRLQVSPILHFGINVIGVIISICFAYGFHLIFEKPFLTSRKGAKEIT